MNMKDNYFPLKELVEVKPLTDLQTSGLLYYLDFVYENRIMVKKRIRKEKFKKLFEYNNE